MSRLLQACAIFYYNSILFCWITWHIFHGVIVNYCICILFSFYIFFSCSLLYFQITGIILLSVGLTVKGYYNEYEHFLNNKYIYASDLLIVIGCVIFIVAFLGCCGAIKESPCLTLTVSITFRNRKQSSVILSCSFQAY